MFFMNYLVAAMVKNLLWFGHGKSIYSSSCTFKILGRGKHPENQGYSAVVSGSGDAGVCADRY